MTFLSEYSIALGYSAGLGATLLAINNGVNSVSRILAGIAGDRLGRQNTLILTIIGSAVAVCGFWLGSVLNSSKSLWLIFVISYGIFAGGYNALYPTTNAETFGLHAYTSVNGFIYFIRGMSALFGSPAGGVILGESKWGTYRNVVLYYQLFSLVLVCVFWVYDILTLLIENDGSGKLDTGHTSLVPDIIHKFVVILLGEIVIEVDEIVMTASFTRAKRNESCDGHIGPWLPKIR